MSEQRDVIADLGAAGVLTGICWAYESATARALETYSEADGHDSTFLGTLKYVLFRDRLDRVFACERYAVSTGNDDADLDVLYEQLNAQDITSMPRLDAGLVRRSNLSGSPGWAAGRRRLLLASGAYGKLDQIPWPQKSPTKRRVATQRNPDSSQPSLFDGLEDEEMAGLEALFAAGVDLDLDTYVVAHSLDPLSGRYELVLGLPRMNSGGGQAWHWRQNLLAMRLPDGGRRIDGAPVPREPNTVADAPVRLRQPVREQRHSDDRASGDR